MQDIKYFSKKEVAKILNLKRVTINNWIIAYIPKQIKPIKESTENKKGIYLFTEQDINTLKDIKYMKRKGYKKSEILHNISYNYSIQEYAKDKETIDIIGISKEIKTKKEELKKIEKDIKKLENKLQNLVLK